MSSSTSKVLSSYQWAIPLTVDLSYTLLRIQDASQFLGWKIVNMKPHWGLITIAPTALPLPLSELARRHELYTWLSRTLLCTLIPGRPGPNAYRCRYPNNLVAFVGLLIHLHAVGFPSHWLSEYLQVIATNNMKTDVAPYSGQFPIPYTEFGRRVSSRKINLDPWVAEFETILALSYEALPFPITLHPFFASSHTEISTFEVKLSRLEFDMMTMTQMLSPVDPVMSLMFYKAGNSTKPEDLIRGLPRILEGMVIGGVGRGQLCILTCVERFELSTGLIRWKMSKKRMEKMKTTGWTMMGYRFDKECRGALDFIVVLDMCSEQTTHFL